MTTFDETIQSLQRDLTDAENDIQAALYSMKTRVTNATIVTHQRRDRAGPEGRPGFFREELSLINHLEAVQKRADMEHTTSSLNFKNWGSAVNTLMEVSAGCVEDGNKIALRVDSIKSALRTMHLLQQHLSATTRALPALPEPDKPGQQPAAKTESKPTEPERAAPIPIGPAEFGTTTTLTASAPPEYSFQDLSDIHFAEENDLQNGEPDQGDEPKRTMSEELDDEDEDPDDQE